MQIHNTLERYTKNCKWEWELEGWEKGEIERLFIEYHFVPTGICIMYLHYLFKRNKPSKSGFAVAESQFKISS